MTTLARLLAFVQKTLEANSLCKNVMILEAVEFAPEQFRLKVRSDLGSGIKFQAYIYANRGYIDYGYQVFGGITLLRWDNKEEFFSIATFPHHHHNLDAEVVASSLSGQPENDLPQVLDWIAQHFDQIREANKREKR